MSFKALTWSWGINTETAGRKLVLVALAQFSDEYNRCWPSQRMLSERTHQSERTIRDHLDWLEENGFIKGEKRAGHPDTFTLLLGKTTPAKIAALPRRKLPGSEAVTPAKIAGGTPADFSKTSAKIAGVVIMSPHQSPEQRGVNTQTAPSKPEPQKRPERPTVEQWVEYAKAKYPWWPSEDAENSWHHYNGNGWRTKTGPVKVWQSTVATCHGFFRKDHPTAEKEWKRRIPVDAPIRNSNGQKPLTRDQYLAMNKGESLEL
jgi:hypothetical protein